MIRNIIFDLGQVLFTFQPKNYLNKHYSNDRCNILMKEIFREREWKSLDRGTSSPKEAIDSILSRGKVNKEEVEHLIKNRDSFIAPIDENLSLLEVIKDNGYNLYILSNFHQDLFYSFYDNIPLLHLFDGKIISSDVQLLKPEPEIYNLLLKKYQLDPSETLFIDDTASNIKAANAFGIKGVHLRSPHLLKKELEDLEIL